MAAMAAAVRMRFHTICARKPQAPSASGGYGTDMQPRNRAPDRALDRPLAVPALELPLPSDGGGFDPRAKAPRVLSAASPTTISAESGSVILTPGGAPHWRGARDRC